MFRRLYDEKKSIADIPSKVWQKYWNGAKISTDAREAICRYAAYLDYKQQMLKNGGKPLNFGASKPETIMALESSVCPESVRGVCVPTAKAGNPGTRGFSKGAIPQAHARMARNLGNRAVCRRLQAAWGRLLSHRFAGCRAGRSSSRAPTGPFPRGAKNSGPISKRA